MVFLNYLQSQIYNTKKIIGQIQIASEDKVDLDKKIVFIKSADQVMIGFLQKKLQAWLQNMEELILIWQLEPMNLVFPQL